ncbi:MAG: IS1634 family transposase, partial [Acidobacteriota bacterium]|nr:IS1634 family transposase [Acidobacteriota bacterium]
MAFVRTLKVKSSSGQIHTYARIVENYRDRKKRKQRVIANLGNVTTLKKNYKQILNGLARVVGKEHPLFKDDLKNKAVKEYGVYYVVGKLWELLKLNSVISHFLEKEKVSLDYAKWIQMMVTNKLSGPKSKLGIFEWLKGVWWPDNGFDSRVFDESLSPLEHEKIRKVEVMKFYRALDHLLKMKVEVENHLYFEFRDLFNMKVDLVFYDVTSSYFEGNGPKNFAVRGYSRDHEPGKNQIVIGLIMCNGLPIGHEVFEGTRVDKKTVNEVLNKLKEQFEIEKCIFVGDRGMISPENLGELEAHGFESILALKKRRNNEVKEILLGPEPLIYCRLNKELEYREVKGENGLRYIVCHNPEVGKEQRKYREENLQELQSQLNKLKEKVNSQKKPQIKRIIRQVEEILSHKHGRRFFNYKVDEKTRKLSYWQKEESLKLEEALDGVYILRTCEPNLTPVRVIYAYKELIDVERAFRTMKSVIDLRPFFHRDWDRVRAHVFICVLAYLLNRVVDRALKKAGIKLSAERAYE